MDGGHSRLGQHPGEPQALLGNRTTEEGVSFQDDRDTGAPGREKNTQKKENTQLLRARPCSHTQNLVSSSSPGPSDPDQPHVAF